MCVLHSVCDPCVSVGDELSMLAQSYHVMVAVYAGFVRQCEAAGWDTSQNLLCADEWRVQWADQASDKKIF